MDRLIARRLDNDEEFQKDILKLVKEYVTLGQSSVGYWTDEFDTAHDLLMCYAPLNRADLESLERGHPKRFVLPVTATQITTMATFIAQTLFGDVVPHKVEGRGPEDDVPAEHMNQLLMWNAEQQPTYLLGYLWIQDILCFNRGIFYNSYAPIYETRIVPVETPDWENIDEATGGPEIFLRITKTKVPVAAYNKFELVSPYNWFADPTLPLHRFQEGRFSGHRCLIPWQELKRRSMLPMDDPGYVLESGVEKLRDDRKNKRLSSMPAPSMGNAPTGGKNPLMSRSAYDRSRAETANPQPDANKNDPGVIECYELYIRMVPQDNELYGDEGTEENVGTEPVIITVLIGNDVILALNESTYQHDEYPYSVAEGRPSGYNQYSPGWVMLLKPLQDYLDYFKNRRQQALTRTLGNVFIARTDQVNIDDFTNPDKEGLIIPVLPEANALRLDDIVKQVPINDVTKDFHQEMMGLISFSETVTGANANMQGQTEGDGTATEFVGTQQMGAGRMSSVARLISVQGLVPQTRQFVSNFQQFLSEPMSVRFRGDAMQSPDMMLGKRALEVTPDTIQGKFDYIAHDGALPGTDARKVAAMTRVLEIAPTMPQFFMPGPGNIDLRAILLATIKAAGVSVENFVYKEQPGMAMPQGPMPLPQQGPPPLLPNLPPEAAGMVGPGAGRPPEPSATQLPSVEPLQARPQNI